MLSGEFTRALDDTKRGLSMVFVNGDRLVCVPEEFAGARCSDRALCAALVHCSPARCPTVAVQSSWQATWCICARSRLGCCVTRIQRGFAGCLDWQVFNHVQVRDDNKINESLHSVCVCVCALVCCLVVQWRCPTEQNANKFSLAKRSSLHRSCSNDLQFHCFVSSGFRQFL